MTYTIIIDKDGEQLVFKGILYFLAEPGRIQMLREKWITVENVEGLILHEESEMSGLSDDKKRFYTDQISMLKNENERLTKRHEDVSVEYLWMRREIERVGHALYTGTKTGYVGTEEDLQAIGQNVEGVCETNERLMNVEAEIDAMRDFMALLYLGIHEGMEEKYDALDDKTKHLINEVWLERLEEDNSG